MALSNKKQHRRKKRIYAGLALGCALLVFIAVAILGLRKDQIDSNTLCPLDGNYARTAILIDATDSLSDSQIKSAMEEINNLRRRLAINEWVGIFILNENNLTLPAPEIALCYPGDGSTASPLYENPELFQRRFEKDFQKPMEDAIKQLAEMPPQATSPIHEMIQAVALDRNFDSTKQRRFIVVSDMLQNTPQYSHYQNGVDFEAWKNSPHGETFPQFSLLGVDVEILYLKRVKTQSVQTRGHIFFWEKYFAELGAFIKILKPIQ